MMPMLSKRGHRICGKAGRKNFGTMDILP